MDTTEWQRFEPRAALPLPLAIGQGGSPAFIDLATLPHLLIAGSTGSGKSVCINAIINGVLLSRTPEQVRMVLVDPKRVELTPYRDIPHLYTPVAIETKEAMATLKALVRTMDDRFTKFNEVGARDIVGHNAKSSRPMPYLMIVIDELADLMMTSGNEADALIKRITQLGRAAGIHMILATQRPSVDVITGVIKSNVPSRISFSVPSFNDSRTFMDQGGGEKLLGKGDMLFLPGNAPKPKRMQGVFLSDEEIARVVSHWVAQGSQQLEQLDVEADAPSERVGGGAGGDAADMQDELVERALALCDTRKTLSVSYLQTKLSLGFPRARRLMDQLEELGRVGSDEGSKPRRVIHADAGVASPLV